MLLEVERGTDAHDYPVRPAQKSLFAVRGAA